MEKVLLIHMPFAAIRYPSLGLSLLKAGLAGQGWAGEIRYLNIDLAKKIGLEIYDRISFYSSEMLFGEWLFARNLFPELPAEEEYKEFVRRLIQRYGFPEEYLEELWAVKEAIPKFLDDSFQSIPWKDYPVIGFSTMFEQNLASLALARRVKQAFPEKIIVFGGANCEGEMGRELHASFPEIDFVLSGEADFTLPELLKRSRSRANLAEVPGLVWRGNGNLAAHAQSGRVPRMDSLPFPDYEDYLAQLAGWAEFTPAEAWLPMETSRGCWWGEKSQCKFCGLSGESLHFRSKSKERVLGELLYLVRRHGHARIFMVDNILDMRYFRDVLPELRSIRPPLQLFYEVKSNLREEHVRLLAEAGVTWIQPGIESLSTRLLRAMSKGVTALQNIQLLKDCQALGVYPTWNLLTGFPGEKKEDYREMTERMRQITHLPPPDGHFPITLERFSPYFQNPEKYGILNVRPKDAYRFIYPLPPDRLRRLAFYFNFDYRPDLRPPDREKELDEAVNFWKESYGQGETLSWRVLSPQALLIEDHRSSARLRRMVLRGAQKEIYEYCGRIRTLSSVLAHVRDQYSRVPFRERDVRDFLEGMVSLNLMAGEEQHYLSLAVPCATF